MASWVDVDGHDLPRAAKRGGHRQHARTCAEVQHAPAADIDVGERTKAQSGARMMPGPESARRLDDDQRRALGECPTADPTAGPR